MASIACLHLELLGVSAAARGVTGYVATVIHASCPYAYDATEPPVPTIHDFLLDDHSPRWFSPVSGGV